MGVLFGWIDSIARASAAVMYSSFFLNSKCLLDLLLGLLDLGLCTRSQTVRFSRGNGYFALINWPSEPLEETRRN